MARTLPAFRFPARTLPALLVHTARRLPSKTFLRFLPPPGTRACAATPREVTFAAFRDGTARAAAFLVAAGVRRGDRVLLSADNSPEWQMIALAAQALGAEPAAVFGSLAPEAAREIARRVAPRVLVAPGEQWEKFAPDAAALAGLGLAAVVGAPASSGAGAIAFGSFGDVVAAPEPDPEFDARCAAVREDDPFLLLFTSGTTGRPKGVRLPQRTIVHAIDSGDPATGATQDDVGLHFLPFGHVAGHDQFALALAQGHELIMVARREDIPAALGLAPTYLFSVPLVYERVRAATLERIAALPRPLAGLARAALAAAGRVRLDGSRRRRDRALTRVADRLVGRAVRARLGGRVRGLFSGGAPAPPALFRFFESLGLPFVELYGMSETAGMISSNLLNGPRVAGSAGYVSPDHEVRLAADGELLVKGPLLFTGYLDAEDEAGAFTEDGFFRTGDLARFEEDGRLTIDGRKKHLVVLSTGKKVSPEPIEQAIAAAPPFEAAVLVGDGHPFVAAAVFVAREELARLAAAGKDAARELLPRVHAALHAFSEFEKPKRLLVIEGTLQEHPAFVTPTLKLRRDVVVRWLGPRLAALYR